jgi:hypothetical protein
VHNNNVYNFYDVWLKDLEKENKLLIKQGVLVITRTFDIEDIRRHIIEYIV